MVAGSVLCGRALLSGVSFPCVSVEAVPGPWVVPGCRRSPLGSLREVLHQFVAWGDAIGVRRLQVGGCGPSSMVGLPVWRWW